MRARHVVLAALLATATLVSAAPAGAAIPESPKLRPPVFGTGVGQPGIRNLPDPALMWAQQSWFAFGTNATGLDPRNIAVIRSTDLWNWEAPGGVGSTSEALPVPPRWAWRLDEGGSFWAPSVTRVGDHFNLYFAARHRSLPVDRPGWCIGVATSDDPAGPYQAVNRPVVCQITTHQEVGPTSRRPARDEGVIDPNVSRAPTGELYLQVKPLGRGWQLQSMRLQADGLAPIGQAHGLLYLDGDARTWEWSNIGHFSVLENPSLDYDVAAESTGRPYVLYYSGGEWQTRGYATGYATCVTPLGPCRKVTTSRAWLVSTRGVLGPGGFMVARGANHQRWAAYHSWEPTLKGSGQARRLHVEPLTYQGDVPVLQNRSPSGNLAAVSPTPNTVIFSGTAKDRDTGRPVRITIREGTRVVGRVATVDGAYTLARTDVLAGEHMYCATIRDDHLAPNALPACRTVTVVDPPPPPTPPSPPPATSTTTTSTTTTTTSSTTTTAGPTTTLPV